MQADAQRVAQPGQMRRFLRSWVQNPVGVGAVAPSGRSLSRLMVQGLGGGSRVVEFGAGTGTVTRAILERGVAAENLVLVERDGHFADLLRWQFPAVHVIEGDAASVAMRLPRIAGQIDCIVSGLPFLLFSTRQRMRILHGAFRLLRKGGVVHQFTYGGRCPVGTAVLDRLNLQAARIGIAARNLPPAFVYRIERAVG
jgi:phosphatidylethanolamine/phosphatidyl-N-methylethanolamine N-methyltransferase